MNLYKKFLLSLKVFTALPVAECSDEHNYSGLSEFIISTGIIVGVLLFLSSVLLAYINALSAFMATTLIAIMVIVLWYSLADCKHLDGFARSVEAIVFSDNESERLNILTNKAIHTVGVVTIFVTLFLKLAAIIVLFDLFKLSGHIMGFLLLLMVPIVSRFSMVYAMAAFEYIGPDSITKKIKETANYPMTPFISLLQVFVFYFILVYFIFSIKLLLLAFTISIVLGVIIAAAVPIVINNFFNGHTDETYGACVELVELGLILITVFSFMAIV